MSGSGSIPICLPRFAITIIMSLLPLWCREATNDCGIILLQSTSQLPPTKSMADASGTSRPRLDMTTASSTSWCRDSRGSGTSMAAGVAVALAWRNDEVGFRNSTGSCKQRNRAGAAAKTESDESGEEGMAGVTVWKHGCVL